MSFRFEFLSIFFYYFHNKSFFKFSKYSFFKMYFNISLQTLFFT